MGSPTRQGTVKWKKPGGISWGNATPEGDTKKRVPTSGLKKKGGLEVEKSKVVGKRKTRSEAILFNNAGVNRANRDQSRFKKRGGRKRGEESVVRWQVKVDSRSPHMYPRMFFLRGM